MQNTHNTQVNLNKQKLGEPQVYLKPVEQTLYSATVPIKKRHATADCQGYFCKTHGTDTQLVAQHLAYLLALAYITGTQRRLAELL